MVDEIKIEQFEARSAVEVAAETRLWKIPKVLASGFAAARTQIESSGVEVVGMPFARYLEIDWQAMRSMGGFAQFWQFLTGKQRMTAGLFCSAAVESGTDALAVELPSGRYVVTYHRGAYHKVDETYRRMVDWAEQEGVELADSSLENYIDDPSEVPADEVRTQVLIAVR